MNKLFVEIESPQAAALANLAGGFRAFLMALSRLNAVRDLTAAARTEKNVCTQILTRVLQLSQLSIDSRYENPNDVALAAYLRILLLSAPALAAVACEAIRASSNCWWASQMVEAARPNDRSSESTITVPDISEQDEQQPVEFALTSERAIIPVTIQMSGRYSEELTVPFTLPSVDFSNWLLMPPNISFNITAGSLVTEEDRYVYDFALQPTQVNSFTVNQALATAA